MYSFQNFVVLLFAVSVCLWFLGPTSHLCYVCIYIMTIFSWLRVCDSVAFKYNKYFPHTGTSTTMSLSHCSRPWCSLSSGSISFSFSLSLSLSLSWLIVFGGLHVFLVFGFMLNPCYLLSEWIFVDPCLSCLLFM